MLKKLFTPTVVLFAVCSALSGCNKEEDDGMIDQIKGNWHGVRSYNIPNSGRRYQYLDVTFNANKTGSLEYEAPSSYSIANFTYSISGNKINCKGVKGSTTGDIDSDFEISFRIEANRLIPEIYYTQFILTRDGSVETDSEGHEIIDDTELLNNIWICDDGWTVLELYDGNYTEYTLKTQNGKVYEKKFEGTYRYDYRDKSIDLSTGNYWEISYITKTAFAFTNKANDKFVSYKAGTSADIPKASSNSDSGNQGNNSNSTYKSILLKHRGWFWYKSEFDNGDFIFYDNDKVTFILAGSARVGSYGTPNLRADGTFYIEANKLICNYTEIYIEPKNDLAKKQFPDWPHGGSRKVVYTIEKLTDNELTLYDGKTRYRITDTLY